MSSLFSSPSTPPSPVIPAPVPTKSSAEVQADAIAERQRLAAAGGRNSTVITATSDTRQPSAAKTLLGAG